MKNLNNPEVKAISREGEKGYLWYPIDARVDDSVPSKKPQTISVHIDGEPLEVVKLSAQELKEYEGFRGGKYSEIISVLGTLELGEAITVTVPWIDTINVHAMRGAIHKAFSLKRFTLRRNTTHLIIQRVPLKDRDKLV